MNMPFELQIADIWEAEQIISQGWPTRIVTLLGPELPPKKDIVSTGDHHLRMEMDDITSPIPGWIPPTADHIQTILKFTADLHEHDRVLIHCRGGISRSTSVSIGVLVQHGVDPVDAIRHVEKIRSCLDPNELVIHLMDHALGERMRLIDAYSAWAEVNPHAINRIPRAYRNEIEDNARELYKTWSLHSALRKGADYRR